jgi:hypothetical protein
MIECKWRCKMLKNKILIVTLIILIVIPSILLAEKKFDYDEMIVITETELIDVTEVEVGKEGTTIGYEPIEEIKGFIFRPFGIITVVDPDIFGEGKILITYEAPSIKYSPLPKYLIISENELLKIKSRYAELLKLAKQYQKTKENRDLVKKFRAKYPQR